jgi:hypothetical protein
VSIAFIPFQLDRYWTSLAWTSQGAYLAWDGRRRASDGVKLLAGGLILVSGFVVVEILRHYLFASDTLRVLPVIINRYCLGNIVRAATAIFAAWQLWRGAKESQYAWLSPVLLAWGLVFWFLAGGQEIDLKAPSGFRAAGFLGFAALSLAACEAFHKRLSWDHLKIPAQGLLPFLFIFTGMQIISAQQHPLQRGGYVAWPLALAMHLWILSRQESGLSATRSRFFHAGWWWLFVLILTWEGSWWMKSLVPESGTWSLALTGLIPALMVLFTAVVAAKIQWPFGRHISIYTGLGLTPTVIFIFAWMWFANLTSSGAATPLPYLPILNPLDLALGFSMVALLVRQRRLGVLATAPGVGSLTPLLQAFAPALSATLFLWTTAILIRTIHHWVDVPFRFDALNDSMVVQTALSIFWSLYAFTAMILATRRGRRVLWIAGAVLLGVVILKLFIVDLDNRGTVWRIVSFIGVGLMLLFIGYFSPLPPRLKVGGDKT